MNKARAILTPLLALARLHWIVLCTLAGLLLLYTLAGFFLVPNIARAQLEKHVTGTLHRQLSIGEITFNPFTLQAQIHDFKLAEADGAPLVGFRHLLVNATLASIWQRAVSLQEVRIDAPAIDLVIAKDGSMNLAALAPAPIQPPSTQPSKPMRVRLGKFSVSEGRVNLQDNTRSKPFTAAIAPVRFILTDFRTDAGYRNAYQFTGTTQAGEQLSWAGEFTVQPLGSSGKLSVTGLKAGTIDAYIYEAVPFKLASGTLTLSGDYRLALDPFGLEVSLSSIAVRDLGLTERKQGASTPLVIPEIDIQGTQFSYASHSATLQQVTVRNAHVDLAREKDGTVSLSRLFASAKAAPTSDSPAIDGAAAGATLRAADERSGDPKTAARGAPDNGNAWKVTLAALQVDAATLLAEDRTVEPVAKFALTPVTATVKGISSDLTTRFDVATDITINGKGRFKTSGQAQLQPLAAQMRLDLAAFELADIQPYLEKVTAMTVHSGQLAVKGDVSYAGTPATAAPLRFNGEAQVADLQTTDDFLHEDFIRWRHLAITGIGFQLNPDRLSIERIVARQPYARVIIAKDRTLNVVRVLNPGAVVLPPGAMQEAQEKDKRLPPQPSAAQDARMPRARAHGRAGTAPTNGGRSSSGGQQAAPVEKVFPASIKLVQVSDGSANFADYSIEPSFATGIIGLNGKVTGLSSNPTSRAKVKLDGKVDKYAPVAISGEVNLLSAAKYTDLAMNFRNLELTTFNPYSGKFAGYSISKGKLSTELKYQVADRKLDAAHHIVLDNLEFGDKTDSKDAAPIPVKLAIALLKDRNGVIDVNLPVSGTLDDPQFRLGPIIWKAALGLLTRVVTAPFAALGALFGGGDELAFVDFPAGSAVLPATEVEKLNKLAKALLERPQLKLSVPLTVVTVQDGDALAQAALVSHLPADAGGPPADAAAKRKRIAALERAYKEVAKAATAYPPELKTGKGAGLDAQLDILGHALLEKLQPDATALTALAQQRSRAVQDALLANTGLEAERVFITERSEGKSEGSNVRMEMKLE